MWNRATASLPVTRLVMATPGGRSGRRDPGGETGTIRGIVKDQNGTKLAGASVVAAGQSDDTSRGGRYRIDQVPAGEIVEVVASASGL